MKKKSSKTKSYPVQSLYQSTDYFSVYALLAYSSLEDSKACYIGQTNDVKRRFHDHFYGQWGIGKYETTIGGSSSLGFLDWAKKNASEVLCVTLANFEVTRSEILGFEGLWLQLAIDDGYQTPGTYRGADIPLPKMLSNQPNKWPAALISDAARPLEIVARNGERLPPIWENFSSS